MIQMGQYTIFPNPRGTSGFRVSKGNAECDKTFHTEQAARDFVEFVQKVDAAEAKGNLALRVVRLEEEVEALKDSLESLSNKLWNRSGDDE